MLRSFSACLAVAVLLTAPREVRACRPSCPDLNPLPPSGSVIPANAAVRIEEWPKIFPLTAMVDGVPVELDFVPELSGSHDLFDLCRESTAWRPSPTPSPGSSLELLSDGFVKFTYQFGAPDHSPPTPLTALSVDLHDFLQDDNCWSCGNGYGLTYWVQLSGGAQDGGSIVVHTIFFNDTGDGTDGAPLVTVVAGSATTVPVTRWQGWTETHDPLTDFCITVRTFDLAGNEAPVAHRSCSPCRARIEAGEPFCEIPPITEPPAWTDADLVVNGQCAAPTVPPLPPPDPGGESTTGDDPNENTSSGTTGASTTGTAEATTAPPGPSSSSGTFVSTSEPLTSGAPPGSTAGGEPGGSASGSPATTTGLPEGLVQPGCACRSTSGGAPWFVLLAFARRRQRALTRRS